jgi:flagellin
MSIISPVNNVTNIIAENSLSNTQAQLQTTLEQLSTGNELVSPSIAPANTSISAGLDGNIAALTQSAQNTQSGVGLLQTAAGALAQVTTLLNTAVTLATQASTGGLSTAQSSALDTEFQSILTEIGTIGSTTNFNGTAVFGAGGAGATLTVFTSDGTSSGSNTVATIVSALTTTALGLNGTSLTSTASAQTALADITAAISTVSANSGAIGSSINQLNSSSAVASSEQTNLQDAVNNIQNTDIPSAVSQLTQEQTLQQIGFSALQSSQQAEQLVEKLFQ